VADLTDFPIRFGVLAGAPGDRTAWRATVTRAETLGYSTLLVPDHIGQGWGPFVSLASAAQWTSDLTLGTLMLAADLRPAAVVYQELASLSYLAPAGLEIGVGAGWLESDFRQCGIDMEPPARRIERLSETVRLLREMWDDGTAPPKGEHLAHQGVQANPRPSGDTLVRWVMGGGGDRMLAAAARHADIVSLSATLRSGAKDNTFGPSATRDAFERRARMLDAHPEGASAERQIFPFVAAVTGNPDRFSRLVAQRVLGLDGDEARQSPLALFGTVAQIRDRVRAVRETVGVTYWVVPEQQAEAFAPVVEALSGS
jgi:probable F420-dependent oxidoreductase